jgi:cyclopropane fatty-acyl-phospholipid synthase-like methyltransferase
MLVDVVVAAGPHYANTLAEWRRRMWARLGPSEPADGDEKKRGVLDAQVC